MTERYVTDRYFPDKAIDALDEVGSKVHLRYADVPPEIINMEKEIAQVIENKKLAAKNQNFELAAGLRDKQARLEKELDRLQHEWEIGDNRMRERISGDDVADVVSIMTGVRYMYAS